MVSDIASLTHTPAAPAAKQRWALAIATVFIATTIVVALAVPSHAVTLAAGFEQTEVISGRYQPTAVRFAPDGRVFVAEKSGLLWAYDGVDDPSPVLVADLREHVHNFWDRGMLGLAIDPNFPAVPHLYVLYTHDVFPDGTGPRWGTGGASPSTDDPCPTPPGPVTYGCQVFGRLSRLVLDVGTLQASEEPLLDANWCQQYPSHSLGDLVFGGDGYLYASAGDGANFNVADWGQLGDPVNPCDDPPDGIGGPNNGTNAEGGSLRAQDILTPFDPASYDGTVLRIDVAGPVALAPPDNPLVGNGIPDDDFIVAIGLRNPYRMAQRPGSNEIWIGDVGWGTWEEINRLASQTVSVTNFGWPCYEGNNAGNAVLSGFSGRDLCQIVYNEALPGGTVKVPPHYAYRHNEKVVAGEVCPTGSSAITGVTFHRGSSYPAAYDSAIYFADSSRKCVWTMFADAAGDPDKTNRAPLVSQAAGRVVDIQMGLDDKLHYVDYDNGKVFRIDRTNQAPTADATAIPTNGIAPLAVQFDGSGSSDPEDGSNLAYAWDLDDDGAFDDSTLDAPALAFALPGAYSVHLRVTDSGGLTDTDTVIVNVAANQPPTADATATPTNGVAPLLVQFNASSSSDPEDGSNLDYDWDLDDDGTFDDSTLANPTLVFTQAGVHPVHLRVTDTGGLTDTDTVVVTVGNTAPVAQITAPSAALAWTVGQNVAFAGNADDDNDGPLPPSQLSWELRRHECPVPGPCQIQTVATFEGVATGNFVAPDATYPSFLELRLTATDLGAAPLTDTTSVFLDPQTVFVTLESSPPGLDVAIAAAAGPAPLALEVIVGSSNSVTATSPQTVGETSWAFATWSDGGAQSHIVTAPAAATVLTATFDPGSGCQLATPPGCDDGNACNGIETCDVLTGCQSGTPLACQDGNICTDDTCDPLLGCVFPHNDAPCDDGSACTTSDRCTAGVCVGSIPPDCDDGNLCTDDSCDDDLGCLNDTAPAATCLAAGSSSLLLKVDHGGTRHRVKWKWRKGSEFMQSQLGDPTVDTQYALCVYDFAGGAGSLSSSLIVDSGAAWQNRAPRGLTYVDKSGASSGVQKIRLKTGSVGRSLAQVSGKGVNVPIPDPIGTDQIFAAEPRVTVQLKNSTGACWTSSFEEASRNSATQYKAKGN